MNPAHPKVTLLGIPYDAASSYLRGAALAPAKIREALRCDSTNTFSEAGYDVASFLEDGGDLAEFSPDPMRAIEGFVSRALASGARPLILGGDHSVTYPSVRALARRHKGLTILHFDAHPDLYDEFQGSRFSHACPFARIMEEGLARRLVQIGIRTANTHQREQAARFGVEIVEARQWDGTLPALDSPVYVSFDMDVLDPAFAPGVSHHEPGGLSTRQALAAMHNLRATVVGADVVELNPTRDPLGITAMCAAKIAKELAVRLWEGAPGS